jgi:hypothetical protein
MPYVSLSAFARLNHMSRSTVRWLCAQPGFPAIRIGRRVYIGTTEAERWLARRNGGTSDLVPPITKEVH